VSKPIDDKMLVTPRILWAAFLFAQVMFAGVGYMSTSQTPPSPSPSDELTAWIIAGIGAVEALASFFVVPMIADKMIAPARKANPDVSPMSLVFTPYIVGLALRESGAVFALVALFLTGDFLIWLLPAGLAFASTALAYPSAERFQQWLRP